MKNQKQICLLIIIIISGIQLTGQTRKQSCPEVKISSGVPALWIDGTPFPPYAYMSYLGEEKYYKEAADAGIHLYCFPAYLGDRGINSASGIGPFRSPIWTGENQYDFSGFVTDFEKILKSDSLARVIIRLHLDPPLWWEQQNPQVACLLPDGSTFRTSFFSEKWKIESGKVLQACIEWLLSSPYSVHLIGIHVAGGSTEEWFYHFKEFFYDENPERLQKFRIWLRQNYEGDNFALQKAWNNKAIDFATAQLADISGEERGEGWLNKERDQNIIDTYKFHCETMADNIAYFCRIVKETGKGCLLTGAFYGYQYYVTDPRRGHGALSKLLDCSDLDYLSSPNVYNRVIGEDWPPMAATESVKLHGKLWLVENDTRTSITTLLKDRKPEACPPGQYETGVWLGPDDMETSVSFLWKNLGRMLTSGYGGWWFDMWGGWFSSPELLLVLEKTQQYHEKYPPAEENKMSAQVCVIIDEELCFWDASLGRLTTDMLENRYPLAKSGAPYDLYLRTDLNSITTSRYCVIWFMGALELNEGELQKIKEWQRQGIMVIWTDGYGTKIFNRSFKKTYFNEKFKFSDSQLRELWKEAGVHVYIETDDVFYIGRKWMCIHTVNGGEKIIKFPFYAEIIDPLTQKVVSDSTELLKINLAPISTAIFRVNPY